MDTDAEAWCEGPVAAALDEEPARRGLPPYRPEPAGPDPGPDHEEKLIPPTGAFAALCREALTPAERSKLLDWTDLVPVPFDGPIELPVPSAHGDRTAVCSVHRVLPLAERVADALGLPDDLPDGSRSTHLTSWFLDFEEHRDTLAARAGRRARDLPAAFCAARYLRAARHCLHRGRPMTSC
ncbi:hypothetical protein ACFV1L_18865 [Kitasatospora sp. NPDC059646]|uniref:hypothetical protein n=1 Tax=Kitasatospora sp. NPDC059646 TaxID=3346893 RepID=UPI0036964FD4